MFEHKKVKAGNKSEEEYEMLSDQQLLETSNMSNSGQAIYKEVSLSLKFSNKGASDSQGPSTRKVESRVQEP